MNKITTIAFGFLLIPIFPVQLIAEPYSGTAEILSGETLQVDGKIFRLRGIDAPELGQICTNKSGKSFDCGRISATGMMDLTAGTTVHCEPINSNEISPILAVCKAAGYDLSEGMVYTGWALADPQTGEDFSQFQQQAEDNKNGLWAGQFELPWVWRKSHP